MEQLTPKASIAYMKKLGISSLTKNDNNLNLALGGLDKGISPLEMAAAYATIANDGIYIKPTFYTKVENSIGKTVVKSKQTKRKVMSEQVAYILKSLLEEPVTGNSGTATYCKISGIDVAAKTGTTNDDYDRWLCGFTPYYTAVTWFGFDLNETINFNHKNPSGQIWSSVMSTIHSGLSNKRFDVPDGLVTVEICSDTGLLANSSCKSSYTEYFLKGTAPVSYCSSSNSQTTNNSKIAESVDDTFEQ
jgi:penicillin-binding protein 1A